MARHWREALTGEGPARPWRPPARRAGSRRGFRWRCWRWDEPHRRRLQPRAGARRAMPARPAGWRSRSSGSMQRRGGLWFGWSGAVTETGRRRRASPSAAASAMRRIDLTEAEHRGYYTGYSNGVLWPMLHSLPHLMTFRRQDLDVYRKVNRRFADNLVPLLRPDDRIWVHDYHLMSLPGALRQRGVLRADRLLPACPLPGAGSGGGGARHPRPGAGRAGGRPARLPDRDGPRQFRRDRGRLRRRGADRRPVGRARRPAGAARRLPGRDRRPGIRRHRRGAGGDRALPAAGALGARPGAAARRRPAGPDQGAAGAAGGLPPRRRPPPGAQPDHAADRRPLARGRAGLSPAAAGDRLPRPAAINSEFGEPDWTPAAPAGPAADRATRWRASCGRPGSASSRRSATA